MVLWIPSLRSIFFFHFNSLYASPLFRLTNVFIVGFNLSKVTFFSLLEKYIILLISCLIEKDFPRIREKDLVDLQRMGILKVNYEISLAACEIYKINKDNFNKLL